MNNIYRQGFQDGFQYIQKLYTQSNKEDKDLLTPFILGGGTGVLGGSLLYGGLKSNSEIKEHEKLLEELKRNKNVLNTLESDLTRVDQVKGKEAFIKDVLDVLKKKLNPKEVEEDIKNQNINVSRLKDMIQKRKNEIGAIEKKIKPLRDTILRNRGIGAAIGLGVGLTGAGIYNAVRKD